MTPAQFMVAEITGLPVGAKRWPYHHAHPGCWGMPWSGRILAYNAPAVWENTLAFPNRVPSQAEVDAHVAKMGPQGHEARLDIPVLWDFGDKGKRIHWESLDCLRLYSEDLAAWEKERIEAYVEAGEVFPGLDRCDGCDSLVHLATHEGRCPGRGCDECGYHNALTV